MSPLKLIRSSLFSHALRVALIAGFMNWKCSSRKNFIGLFFAALFFLPCSVFAVTTASLSPEGLMADCRNGPDWTPDVVVTSRDGVEVYRSTGYSNLQNCRSDMATINGLILSAKTQKLMLNITDPSSESPAKDFVPSGKKAANEKSSEDSTAASIENRFSPNGLTAKCLPVPDTGFSVVAVTRMGEREVYQSTEYSNHGNCDRDASAINGQILSAKNVKRLLRVKFSNHPDTDFTVSAKRDEETSEQSDHVPCVLSSPEIVNCNGDSYRLIRDGSIGTFSK